MLHDGSVVAPIMLVTDQKTTIVRKSTRETSKKVVVVEETTVEVFIVEEVVAEDAVTFIHAEDKVAVEENYSVSKSNSINYQCT